MQIPRMTNKKAQRLEIKEKGSKLKQLINFLVDLNERTGGVHQEEAEALKASKKFFSLDKSISCMSLEDYYLLGSLRHWDTKPKQYYPPHIHRTNLQVQQLGRNHFFSVNVLYKGSYHPRHIEVAFSNVTLSSLYQFYLTYDNPPTFPIFVISCGNRSYSLDRVYGFNEKEVVDLSPNMLQQSFWIPTKSPAIR